MKSTDQEVKFILNQAINEWFKLAVKHIREVILSIPAFIWLFIEYISSNQVPFLKQSR